MDPLTFLLLLCAHLIHRFLAAPYLTHTVSLGDFDFPCPDLLLRYEIQLSPLAAEAHGASESVSVYVLVRAASPKVYLMTC